MPNLSVHKGESEINVNAGISGGSKRTSASNWDTHLNRRLPEDLEAHELRQGKTSRGFGP